VDRQKSQSSKYALNIPSERVTHRDIVEFVGRYLKGDLQTYKVSEEDPKHILNATDIVPLNRKMFLEWVSSMKATRTDFIVLFYTNDGCTLCEGLWPLYE
jgi:aspartate carbamoyltransferase regulatory subunit